MKSHWEGIINNITETLGSTFSDGGKSSNPSTKLQKSIIRTAERAALTRQRAEQKALRMQKSVPILLAIGILSALFIIGFGFGTIFLGWDVIAWSILGSIFLAKGVIMTAVIVAYNPLQSYQNRLDKLNDKLSVKLINPDAPLTLQDRIQNFGDQVVTSIEQFDIDEAKEAWQDWKYRVKKSRKHTRKHKGF